MNLRLVSKWDSTLDELNDFRAEIPRVRLDALKDEATKALAEAGRADLEALHSALALIHYRLHDPDGQLDHTRALAQLRPWSLLAQRNYAANLFELGQVEEGIRIMSEVVRHPSPERSRTLGDLALALMRIGEVDRAVGTMRDAVRYADYTSDRDLFSLAAHSAQLGFQKQALELLARYLSVAFGATLDDQSAESVVRRAARENPGQLWLAARVPALRLSILQAFAFDREHSSIPWDELERETVPDSVAENTRIIMDWMAPLSDEASKVAWESAGEGS